MSQNTIQWVVENHIILVTPYEWNTEQLMKDCMNVSQMLAQSDLPLVHTLWDFQALEKYPTNLLEIRKAIEPLFTNDRLGWVITITENPMLSFLSQAGSSMYRVRFRTFKMMDDAKAFLVEQDPMLQAL